ncbi:MAG: NUDIX domain-containing protein [Clostridia bacterium]|nr:NUDIX domain-containing protein [Clostridia bacterium]
MEIFDVYDRNGNVTEKTRIRGTDLPDGEYYLGIHVYICRSDGSFLLQKRAEDKKFQPGAWEILLEHAIAGETSAECACRGVQEELGLSFPPEQFVHVTRLFWHEYHHIVDAYFLTADISLEEITLQKTELTDVKWISYAAMLDFLDHIDYRPEEYLSSVRTYIEDTIGSCLHNT